MKISPPAFPTYLAENMAHGMSLRDYFAAAAMQGAMSAKFNCKGNLNEVAKVAYMLADAMLKAREE